jgi:hypothetical protein
MANFNFTVPTQMHDIRTSILMRGPENLSGFETLTGWSYTVIRFVSTSAKFGICTVVGPNGTLAAHILG